MINSNASHIPKQEHLSLFVWSMGESQQSRCDVQNKIPLLIFILGEYRIVACPFLHITLNDTWPLLYKKSLRRINLT